MSGKNAKKDRKELKLNESPSEWAERVSKKTDFNLVKPFGPDLGMFQIPDEVQRKFIDLTDKVLEDQERVDWGKNLVGNIKEEPYVSNKDLQEVGLYPYLQSMLYNYVWNSLTRAGHEIDTLQVHMDHMWIVSQYADEYNPIHFHTYCDLSAVLWLKMPLLEDRVKSKRLPEYKMQRDGMIEFVYKTACPGGLEKGSISFMPTVGQMAIFPSNLLHTVYPFKGDGERRSVAFNSHWNAKLKNGKMYDKAMRHPSDQTHEEYQKTLRSKSEVSGFAERKPRSPGSGDSEEKDES